MKSILILEDDQRLSQALAVRLTHAGYQVSVAPDPVFGAMLVALSLPDLIICDIWMPLMQGLTFMQQRGSFGLRDVPFIFITASQKQGLWEAAVELGAAGYFEKPYDSSRLLSAVSNALRDSAPAQESTRSCSE